MKTRKNIFIYKIIYRKNAKFVEIINRLMALSILFFFSLYSRALYVHVCVFVLLFFSSFFLLLFSDAKPEEETVFATVRFRWAGVFSLAKQYTLSGEEADAKDRINASVFFSFSFFHFIGFSLFLQKCKDAQFL